MFKLAQSKKHVHNLGQTSGETAEEPDSFHSDHTKLQDPRMGGYVCSRH